MKFVGLLSGGKDSLFAVGKAIENSHHLVCIANLYNSIEADSFMFQTSGTVLVPAVSKSLQVPLVSRELRGKSLCKNMSYAITEKDEVEDLYELLLEAKYRFPELEAVVSGAVLSDYQRIRVEHVCSRLGLTSISPLWRYNQSELLNEMLEAGYRAVIVKISSMGLQEKHLGAEVTGLIEYFDSLKKKFGFNVAGEGGEYETLIIDSPIMHKRLVIQESENVMTGNSAYSPYGHLIIKKLALQDKVTEELEEFTLEKPACPQVHRRHGEVFVGEITAKTLGIECSNFEHETFCVLKGLREALETQGLDLTHVYYVNVYAKSMKEFAVFNSVYSKFFKFPNPPSRVFCELGEQDCRVKISARATLSKKKCTHVQSISNWAPASIGPYSQAYSVNSSLHLAGSIPLVPSSMVLSANSLDQILFNLSAVASVNEFSIENPEACIVYYTNDKIIVPEVYNPFYIQVTGLPRASPLEIELHLQKNLPAVEKVTKEFSEDWGSGKIIKRHCNELINLNWYIEIHSVNDYSKLVSKIEEELLEWFSGVKHKSGINKEQLLGSQDIIVKFNDYISEVRVYGPQPYNFQIGWVKDAPTAYLNSTTVGMLIQIHDVLQVQTYQFINSGN